MPRPKMDPQDRTASARIRTSSLHAVNAWLNLTLTLQDRLAGGSGQVSKAVLDARRVDFISDLVDRAVVSAKPIRVETAFLGGNPAQVEGLETWIRKQEQRLMDEAPAFFKQQMVAVAPLLDILKSVDADELSEQEE